MRRDTRFKLPAVSIVSYVLGAWFIGSGFFKMWIYKASEYSWESSINAYVGGDAYNYIINAGYASAFFTLALLFVVFGSTFAIIEAIKWAAQSTNVSS